MAFRITLQGDARKPVDPGLKMASIAEIKRTPAKRFQHPRTAFFDQTYVLRVGQFLFTGICAATQELRDRVPVVDKFLGEIDQLAFLGAVMPYTAEVEQAQAAIVHEKEVAGMRVAVVEAPVVRPK